MIDLGKVGKPIGPLVHRATPWPCSNPMLQCLWPNKSHTEVLHTECHEPGRQKCKKKTCPCSFIRVKKRLSGAAAQIFMSAITNPGRFRGADS